MMSKKWQSSWRRGRPKLVSFLAVELGLARVFRARLLFVPVSVRGSAQIPHLVGPMAE